MNELAKRTRGGQVTVGVEGRKKPTSIALTPEMTEKVRAAAFEETSKTGKKVSGSAIVQRALDEYFAAKIL